MPEREIERPGTLFVGRAGPSVALLVSDDADPVVVVGRPVGEWIDPATLQWAVDDVIAEVTTPTRDSPATEVDVFVARLGEAVESAFADALPELVVCRFCGTLVAPEHLFAEETCHACASEVHGVVY